MNSRLFITMAAIVALASGIGVSIFLSSSNTVDRNTLRSKLLTATLLPENFKHIPKFELLDQRGTIFTPQNLIGKWQLLSFGYTHCPDVCPFTLTTLQQIDKQYSTAFITIDPNRDTPEHLKTYLNFFNPAFIGLSGEESETNKLAMGLGAIYSREENAKDPKNYLMDHSASLFLRNPLGELAALFGAPYTTDSITQDLITLIQSLTQH